MLQRRPNTFAQTILSPSFFACDKAADHTSGWLTTHPKSCQAWSESDRFYVQLASALNAFAKPTSESARQVLSVASG
jgi:hypothetical protein